MSEESTPPPVPPSDDSPRPPATPSKLRRRLGSRTAIGVAAAVLGLGIGGGAVLLLIDRGDRIESTLLSHGEHATPSNGGVSAGASCGSHDEDGRREGTSAAGRHDETETEDPHHDTPPAAPPAAPPR